MDGPGCVDEGEVPIATYVVEMCDRLEEMAELVHQNLDWAQRQQKTAHDRDRSHEASTWGKRC